MKILLEKLFIKIGGWEFILLFIPFVLWVISFHAFFTGHIGLQQDAISYAYHIGIYTDNLKKGVYPLWFPQWYSGFPYHFFLRRIGDVNPLLFSIVFLKWLGVSSATSYLVFLAVYYFLAGWALYLITRFLLVDRFYAFTAYILFLFSSWGCEIFYNYIVIIYVPIIWFFYFILCFSRTAKRSCFLGAFFCVGLIATTYIPFFFVIILAVFSVLFVLFYGNVFIEFTKTLFKFCNKNKIFVFLCATFLFVSCVPAFVFYKESKAGEFVLPDRHSGADASSAIAVGLSNVASGDIVNHGFFDRIFNDHIHLDMGDIYIPYMFFLILLVATFARVNKLIFFLLFNILGISLVTITSAGGVHRFLYDHVIFFKFIRNIYYLFWLAILPMVILLSVSAFQSLLKVIDNSSKKMFWMVYVIICHLLFILFLSQQQGVLIGAWFAVGISLVFFIIYCLFEKGISYPLGFCAILLAVFIQSAQVYGFLSDRIYQIEQDSISYSQTHPSTKILRLAMYYGSSWFEVLVNFIDPTVLENYRIHPFILYDNVAPYADSPQFLKIFEQRKINKDRDSKGVFFISFIRRI